MLFDARSVPDGTEIETDVCIIGGGAAGITVAREFIDSGFRAVLLESGGSKPDRPTQDLYDGRIVGRPYERFPDSRFRYFGGTTNRWGRVWCDLPTPLDFEEREGVPYTGWPFPIAELDPWYRRAQGVLRFGPSGYELPEWGITPGCIPEPFGGPHFVCRVLQQAPATRFGREYKPELQRARNLSVYLHANALRFDAGEGSPEVRRLRVGVLPDGRFSVRARVFVLASGGIENARLLLLSENEAGVALGNDRGLVGRYFQLHLEYTGGEIDLKVPASRLKFQTGEQGAIFRRVGASRRFVSYILLSDETRRRLKLANLRVRFQYPRPPEIDALTRLVHRNGGGAGMLKNLGSVVRGLPGVATYGARRVIYGRNKPTASLRSVTLNCTSEQLPNPESRVGLGEDLDAFGLRKIVVDWRLSEEDRRGMTVASRLLGEELDRSGFGRLRSTVPDDDAQWPRDLRGDQHHMGTTRMHRDPSLGVVDENCRVHGVPNLYVAGCSVFPTSGTFNSALTIVALALRLADQIKKRHR
ncbi:GMC oxidoreductase [Paludisphaera soli]|uniref:GMC oxidoreductase n=1 Tax=Paludisphaera soli TaxID=2712865 RepID=UPI0013EB75D4|nr:GMC family oxidoreductase [Paludisphaera soli]